MAPVLSEAELAKLTDQLETKLQIQPYARLELESAFLAVQRELVQSKKSLWDVIPERFGPGEKKLILAYGARVFGHKEGARTAKEWAKAKQYKRRPAVYHRFVPAVGVGLTAGLLVSPEIGLILGGVSLLIDTLYASLRGIFS